MQSITNILPNFGKQLSETEKTTVGRAAPAKVRPFLGLWGDMAETPLVALPEIAAMAGVGDVVLKDEGVRLGRGSFKSLGGAYAVMVLFRRQLEEHLGQEVAVPQLVSPTARTFAEEVTVCCATDGNHGKSVAAGARLLGCRSVIFIHAGVSQVRAEAIGADEIVRVDGSYDDSVDEAKRVAAERGWLLVADTSWPGYEEIPGLVAQGYTILAEEALQQMKNLRLDAPTHVFLQAGVGGFAASIAGYLTDVAPGDKPRIVIVEPDRAACLFESARVGALTSVEPGEPTVMAMLECFTPSLSAWRMLEKIADAFVIIGDEDAEDAMRLLAGRPGTPVVAGESGAAGLAGLLAAAKDETLRATLKLGPASRVLLINTETATDPGSFTRIVGRAPGDVVAMQNPAPASA